MKKGIMFCALAVLSIGASCFAQSLTGYEIMKKADEVPTAQTSSYTATMTLTDKNGKTRIREVKELSKEFGDTTKTIIIFTTPKDVAGVGYLMFEYKEKPDGSKKDSDNWLYMPALKKVRRISSSDSEGDFMGTDFTYEDMGDRALSKDTFTLLGEEDVDGVSCYKVEAVAKDSAEKNPRRILWIRKDNFLLAKGEYYDRQGALSRKLFCSDIEKIDGWWTTQKMLMQNVQKKHSTLIEMKNVSYNLNIDDSLFTVNALEKERIK